ncbi:helix-turn-helix domain-containing protein [Nocardia speluncae]|uniref:Helix-turn-helix domain-containing protein n=1 Tax=Nocardia speluncae TaxID=419477 RepID=A0A846XBI7_9NOCA|nr:helix-turn-helix domain-containing protein [Nocardia speluncae]NKY32787.1 helix-turn-helix domain-containing protein [Nocardia speluncae]
MPGSRLSEQDRIEIAAGLRAGIGYAAIARQLDRPTSTISREVNRNGGPGRYRPEQAHRASRQRSRRQANPDRTQLPGDNRDDCPALPAIGRLTSLFVDTGMPHTASGVLAFLMTAEDGSSVAAELATTLRVSPAAISAAVGYLQAQELISKKRDEPRRRDRYIIDETAWVRATIAGARQNAAIARAARTGAAEVGATTAAGERLAGMADFLDHVARDITASAQRWATLLR